MDFRTDHAALLHYYQPWLGSMFEAKGTTAYATRKSMPVERLFVRNYVNLFARVCYTNNV